jgi:hypothetical protein
MNNQHYEIVLEQTVRVPGEIQAITTDGSRITLRPTDSFGWISLDLRSPTVEDADEDGCVR